MYERKGIIFAFNIKQAINNFAGKRKKHISDIEIKFDKELEQKGNFKIKNERFEIFQLKNISYVIYKIISKSE